MSESNAELEGARTPGDGPTHGRDTPDEFAAAPADANAAARNRPPDQGAHVRVDGGVAVPEPSVVAGDVARGQNVPGDATGDTAPREAGGQAANPPRSLGSAGGGSTGPGSANHNE